MSVETVAAYPCFTTHGATIRKSPASNCAASIQTTAPINPINPNDRYNHDADGDLFPEPGMLVGLGRGGVGRFALGADVVFHGALSVRLAKGGHKKSFSVR